MLLWSVDVKDANEMRMWMTDNCRKNATKMHDVYSALSRGAEDEL